MELRHLEYFVELCKVRNFTKAAENLHAAQPSITKAVRQLEEELEVQLVDRSQRPLGLTKAGERFYLSVQHILQQLDDAAQEAKNMETLHRAINFGISPQAGIVLEWMLTSPKTNHGGFFYNIIERSSLEIVRQLMNKELDLGWVISKDLPSKLEFIPVETQELVLLLPPDSPLQEKKEITLADIHHFPLSTLTPSKNAALTQLVLERFQVAGFEPEQDLSENIFHPDKRMLIEWVHRGFGPVFVPQYLAGKAADIPSRPVAPPLTFSVGLAYNKSVKLIPQIKRFIDYICVEYPRYAESYRQNDGATLSVLAVP